MAIDVKTSQHAQHRVWPVTIYDGKVIPFQNDCFDIVFSSNVLEHIPHVNAFQNEIKRVLKHCGRSVHILPSGSWRFWSLVTHYIYISKLILLIINLRVFHKNQRIREKHELCTNCPQSQTGPAQNGKRIRIVPRRYTVEKE